MSSPCDTNEDDDKKHTDPSNEEKDTPSSENNDNKTVDLTRLFEPDKIRRLLYHEEPKMARIQKPSLQLIGTASALFLQKLVSAATDNEQQLVSLDGIRDGISSNPAFRFLESTLDDVKDTDKNNPKEYVSTNSNRKRAVAGQRKKLNSKKIKADVIVRTETGQNESLAIGGGTSLEEAIANARNTVPVASDEIVVDEDDYD